MDNFLQHIANIVYRKYEKELDRICMVFPSRRAGLFFSKYLSEITVKPIWSPACKTINELMQDLSDLQVAENLELIFELYKVFRKETGTTEGFDDFYYWGEMLLNDFDDIDKYLVNAADLFHNLEALKELEDHFSYLSDSQIEAIKTFWKNLNPTKDTKHKSDFIQLWPLLNRIYSGFRSALLNKRRGYEGMAYREVVEKIIQEIPFDLEFDTFIMVGFNALNSCEERLFEFLYKQGKGMFFWDYDESYLHDINHEAGFFIRKNMKRFPQAEMDFSFSHLEGNDKMMEVIAVPTGVAQAKLIPRILEKIPCMTNDEHDKTAIVLADEQLLMPVLYSIPPEIEKINVTMGYPIKDTPLYSLVIHLIDLQKRKKGDSDKNLFFYHKPVLSILSHQYILRQNIPEIRGMIGEIIRGNKIFVDASVFKHNELLNMIFRKVDTPEHMSTYLMEILLYLFHKLNPEDQDEQEKPALHQEYMFHLYLAIQQLGNIITDEEVTLNLETYLKLLNKLVKNRKIPFTGEPLAGLQIMGILETRTLDFENLILLSLNEGILPRGQSTGSFVPYNLRKGFGLPTFEHQDSIYAYYFYRLIQRAKNITFIYNNNSEGMKSGEMSRFLTQLKYNQAIKPVEKTLAFDIQIVNPGIITIEKDERIMLDILSYSGNAEGYPYLSPSGINTYLDCSLKFYFRYIAGLKEPEEMSEEIDFKVFGNILHKAINRLYSPYKNRMLDAEGIGNLIRDQKKIHSALEQSIMEEFIKTPGTGKNRDFGGRNLVILEILRKYLNRILTVDRNFLPLKILCLEELFTTCLHTVNPGQTIDIRIGGTIDRIDQTEGTVRIIDYKTGKGELNYGGMEKLFQKGDPKRNNAVFQTFLYALLVSDEFSDDEIMPGLYYVRDLYKEPFDYHIHCQETGGPDLVIKDFHQQKEEFLVHLIELVEEMINPAVPFTQVEDEKVCRVCPYRKICHR